ncbi:N-acetylmuramoyl-L-alanine amidase [Planomonospora sp. ID91781]|uniref:N-acetylmuramoyl-L-alanine amidase n=1 Tax=Planomonospora sphaerica TaxID=161355 RepID=A0A161LHD8_9ACTN|nr:MULTISPECIES: N-acetylmuramoyl-L-alanine amidase [Planomonospora]MBG0822246.1 N-acetylmuramoyl-L-alanine amidase [Planomonospora sp. ID91781]GAT64627.1 N-acetylmuramoyl-L-alanine amidase [Planomonospora sphaerica]
MAIDLVTRREWGARQPRGSYTQISSTRGVKVHYTGGRVDPGIVNDHTRCVALVKSIQNSHMDGNGWMDIGYSLVVCPHRKVFEGRGPRRLPAANGSGLNSGHYAVLGLVGSSGLVQPTDNILHGILDAVEYLRERGGAGREIKGHRDGYATSCPGEPLYTWVRRGAPRPGGAPDPPEPHPSFPGRTLKYPPVMAGEDVRTWQQQMRKRGWGIEVDGLYGERSRDVCRAFQEEKGLTATGAVDRLTWNATWQEPIT